MLLHIFSSNQNGWRLGDVVFYSSLLNTLAPNCVEIYLGNNLKLLIVLFDTKFCLCKTLLFGIPVSTD